MQSAYRAALMLCMLLASCVCEATIAAAQSRTASGGQARLYFLRQSGLFGNAAADARVLVNDKSVGIVEAGSYIVIDRPPGHYKLTVGPKIQIGPNLYDVEFNVAPGQVYYFEIGIATSPTGAGWGTALMAGNVGKRMDGRGSFGGASMQFNSLDTATGAAEVKKLKPMKR
jgi:hypothetical protein